MTASAPTSPTAAPSAPFPFAAPHATPVPAVSPVVSTPPVFAAATPVPNHDWLLTRMTAGSMLQREAKGWRLTLQVNGTKMLGFGATIRDAFQAIGIA